MGTPVDWFSKILLLVSGIVLLLGLMVVEDHIQRLRRLIENNSENNKILLDESLVEENVKNSELILNEIFKRENK